MLLPTATIARNTFTESLRQPIFFVVIALGGVLQYLNTAASGYSMGYRMVEGEVTGDDKMLLDVGLATVFIMGTLLAAFISTAAISREIENKTVLTVVAKPIPRVAVILGKYLGVSGAMVIAALILIAQLLLAIHHGVMSTAADDVHWPVIFFSFGAVAVALFAGGFGNFMYGWSFSQTFVLLILPLTVLAYVGSLNFEDDWKVVSMAAGFKPQVLMACMAMVAAILVLTSIAVAASTRLGQVMTLVVCVGVFLLGLLTNHLIGRYAFTNHPVAVVESAEPVGFGDDGLIDPGDEYTITFEIEPSERIEVRQPVWVGPAPNGIGMLWPAFEAPAEDVKLADDMFTEDVPPAIVVTSIEERTVTVKHIGGSALPVGRAPERGDYLFLEPAQVNYAAAGVWSLIPNMHFYWLVDAITQVHEIPPGYILMVFVYAGFQILAALSLATLLFQGRDVG